MTADTGARPALVPRATRYRRSIGDLDGADLVCALVVLTLLLPSDQIVPGLGVTPASLLTGLLAFLWVCLHLGRNLPVAKGRTPVRTAVFLLVGSVALSFVAGMYGYLTEGEVKNSVHTTVLVLTVIGSCLFVIDVVRGQVGLAHIARAFVVASAVVAVAGIVESLVGITFVSHLSIPGLHPTSYADLTQATRQSLTRAQSTTGHPIEFGVLCGMALPFAVHLASRHRVRSRRAVYWSCATVLVVGAVFSISRSAIIALVAVGCVLLVGATPAQRVRATAVVLAGLGVLWMAVPQVVEALVTFFASASTDPSVGARTGDYTVLAAQFVRSPILGHGPGTWYAPVHQIFDNQYLLTLVETGVVGLAVRLAVFVTAAWQLLRLHFRDPDRGQSLPLAGAAGLVVVILTSATFDFGSFASVNTLSFLLVGMAGALARVHGADLPRTVFLRRRPWRVGTRV
ncbi:O-antigen ligase family protein [Actinomycetospora chiangmaiensis]|uniref:O-antigen ligase family protein n=1 Tax=Actinomycetospora chiangmaiensis TaxID=402650 RepID=UPI0003791ED1|nr:O-antigen ligase family protein [Actinomycetospora chiangmaiensis]